MAGNVQPIYSKVADIQASQPLLTAAADYTGLSAYNTMVFKADATNGGFIQRLRFKALGTTGGATVARIYLNPATAHLASLVSTPGAPSATPSSSGGTVLSGTYYAKVVAVDATGALSAVGTESSGVVVTGPTGSIPWTWSAVTGAASYRIYVGTATGAENGYFTSNTNSYTQIAMVESAGTDGLPTATNNIFYGEVSLPSVTASTTAATVDVDYPMNFPVPPGWEVYVGLGVTVTAGWQVTTIAGKY